MHICAGIDRPSLNGHVCSQARLLPTNAHKLHDRRSARRQCSCSYAASTSGGPVEDFQFESHQTGNTTRCMHLAKRAFRRAVRHYRSQHVPDVKCSHAATDACNHSRPSRYSTGQHFLQLEDKRLALIWLPLPAGRLLQSFASC